MNKIYALILPFLGIASATYSMDNNNNAIADNVYQGTLITAQNIAQLARAPQSVVQSFEEFNQKFPALCTVLTKFEPMHFKQNHKDAAQALKDADITNLSSHGNFIFALPNNPNLIAQIAGHRSRIFNISANLGIGDGWNRCANKWCKDQNLDELKDTDPTTYQTISRAANYLMIQHELNKMQNPRVVVSPTYVVPVDSSKNYETANDNTHIVLQERYSPEFIQIKVDKDQAKTDANAALLSNETLLQVCKITSAVKLFDVGSNLMVNPNNGNAAIKDTEQPNDEPSKTFFHNRAHKLAIDYERGNKGKTKAEHDAQMGFEGLVNLSPVTTQQVKDFIKDRNNFPQYSEQGYKEILALAQ